MVAAVRGVGAYHVAQHHSFLLSPGAGLATHRSAHTDATALEYSIDEEAHASTADHADVDDADNTNRPVPSVDDEEEAVALAAQERVLRRKHNEELLKLLEDEQNREQVS